MSEQTNSTAQVVLLSQAFDLFTQHARLRGRSRKTLALYAWVFEQVHRHLGDRELHQLDTATWRRFLFVLVERGWKMTSVSIVHRVLNAFFTWSVREQLMTSNPLDGIPKPKAPQLFPFTLDDSQVAALMKVCNKDTRHGLRNYAMLLLFIDAGLRLNELISLKLTDVDMAQHSLKVHGKGAKDRIIYIGTRTTKTIRRWIEVRGFRPGYSDALFIDRKGEALKHRWVQQVIARIGQRSGLKQRLSPHKLRHVSATLAVRNGIDLFSLQRLYGWSKLETALRYVNAAAPALREAHAKASPVDRLLDS